MRYLLFILILSGCGTFSGRPGVIYPKEIENYVDKYFEYKDEYLGTNQSFYSIIIFFDDLPKTVAGRCASGGAIHTIQLKESYWEKLSEDGRLSLLFHEMGHCDLRYDHQDEKYGIMNSKGTNYRLSTIYVKDFFTEGR